MKLTIHMVASLDGYIAKVDGTTDWMQTKDHYENGTVLTQEIISAFLEKIDCYVMGSKTYETALKLGWPYGEKPVKVLSHRKLKVDKNTVQIYTGDLLDFVKYQLSPFYENIWIVGGAEVSKSFLKAGLIDEIVISFLPIILGEGLLFFNTVGVEQALHLKDVTTYKNGMVELTYALRK